MTGKYQTISIDEWVVRVRTPSSAGMYPTVLLLHGWTGDENVMWIFESRLPDDALIISPRGIYPTPLGGYGWYKDVSNKWPNVSDFSPAVSALLDLLTPDNFPQADFSRLWLAGFSQGAALAYSLVIEQPERFSALAALSGYLPVDVENSDREVKLHGMPIYISHGTQDDLVPVIHARSANESLSRAGAQVLYCEENVGHKLSAACFRGMERFFHRLSTQ